MTARLGVLGGVFIAALGLGCGEPPVQFTAPMVLGGVEVPAEVLNRGQKLYANHCSSCHGADGSGKGPAARHLSPGPRDFRAGEFIHKASADDALPTDAELRRVIKKGVADRGMPAWGGLRDEDVDALVSYIKTFSPRWQAPANDPGDAAPAE